MILFFMSVFKLLLNNSFLWLKAFLAIPILVLISVSHLPSLVMRAPRYLNRSTCSSLSPSIVMFFSPSPFLDTFMTFVFFIAIVKSLLESDYEIDLISFRNENNQRYLSMGYFVSLCVCISSFILLYAIRVIEIRVIEISFLLVLAYN